MRARRTGHAAALLVAITAALVSACGERGDEGRPVATQVAAKVNRGEISVHQVNTVLQRAGPLSPDQLKRASGDALERLIDQELLVQRATEEKLDRSAAVVQAVEAAKREIYARAYVEQIAARLAKPDAAAIATFYKENPDLFAKRRVYNLQELSVRIPDERIPALRLKIGEARTLGEVAGWLRAERIAFNAEVGIKAAEQLPPELLPRFAAAKDGQVVVTQVPGGMVVSYVVESREQPIDEAAATPLIEQSITGRRRVELVQAEIRRLREVSTIDYLGEFSKTPGTSPRASTAPTSPSPAAPTSAVPSTTDQKALAKGAAGLR